MILMKTENVVMLNSPWMRRDLEIVFPDDEPVHFSVSRDLSNLLKDLRVYESTSASRRAGRTGPVPGGYTEMKASKRRMVYIWNPTES